MQEMMLSIMREGESWTRRITFLISIASSLSIVVIMVFMALQYHPLSDINIAPKSSTQDMAIEIKMLKNKIDILQQRLNNSSNTQIYENRYDYNLTTVQDNYKSLDDRMGTIERTIADNPERALALITLRQDVDNLKNSRQVDIDESRREMDRLYDFNKWFLVLIFTLNISFIGIIATYLSRQKQGTSDDEEI